MFGVYGCSISDERALVLGAKSLGFIFHTRTPDHVTVKVVSLSVFVLLRTLKFSFSKVFKVYLYKMNSYLFKIMIVADEFGHLIKKLF